MSRVGRACGCVIALATLAATSVAQAGNSKPPKGEQPPTRVTREIVIGEGVRVEKNPSETRKVGQAAVTYTPNLNHTSVGVMMEEVYRRGEVTTNLEFSFGFEGREPARPKQVSWAFLADWNLFRSGAPLVVEVDGRRFSFRPERDMSMPGQHVGQMDFATFERVANSKRARLSVGRVAFILSESQREALRDMLKALETPAK